MLAVASALLGALAAGAQDIRDEVLMLRQQIQAQDQRIRELESNRVLPSDLLERIPDVDDSTTELDPAARPESTDARLDRLEQTLMSYEERDAGFLESLSTYSRRIVNGRLHIDAWTFPQDSPGINIIENGTPAQNVQNRLLYRRLRFGVRGTVPPGNMSYRLEIEYSGQDGSQFRDAWLGWDDLHFFNTLRVGNQKRPYGLDHLNSSNFNIFMERPFIVDALNQDNRRFGVVSYGISDDQRWNWRYGVFALPLVQNIGSIVGDKTQLEGSGRLANTWWYDETTNGRGYGHAALAFVAAYPNGEAPNRDGQFNEARFRTFAETRSNVRWINTDRITGATSYYIVAAESVFNAGPLQIGGEWMSCLLQRSPQYGEDPGFHGGYVYVAYTLTGEHVPWNRGLGILGRLKPLEDFFAVDLANGCVGRGWGAWQVAARYSYADFNDQGVFGGYGQSATIALNWYWNAHARLQFNYIFGEIDNRNTTPPSGNSQIVSGDYQILGTRFIIDF